MTYKDPNTEFLRHLSNIKRLSPTDEERLKENIPWLYDLFHGLPLRRPEFNLYDNLRGDNCPWGDKKYYVWTEKWPIKL
jgi:hypothetical protein